LHQRDHAGSPGEGGFHTAGESFHAQIRPGASFELPPGATFEPDPQTSLGADPTIPKS
jgi:putative (di)nucleoside polyphosphate hydrolase